MKLNYLQVKLHLDKNTKNLLPVYLIAGDEWWLKQDTIKLIRLSAKGASFNSHFPLTIDHQFDWNTLHYLLYNIPLLAEKRIVHLKFQETLPNKIGNEILSAYAKQPVLDQLLLIEMAKVDSKTTQAACFKLLEKGGCLINIWPLSQEQFSKWISIRAKKYKLTLQADALLLLNQYVEGNLAAASQLLEKLYLLQPEQPIDTTIINSIVNNNESLFTIFNLTDSIIARDSKRAVTILDHLKKEGVEPVLILWSITRELRLLIELASQLGKGVKWGELLEKYRIFSHRQDIMRQFVADYSIDDCLQFLRHAGEIDRAIKGALSVNAWQILQVFCLRVVEVHAR